MEKTFNINNKDGTESTLQIVDLLNKHQHSVETHKDHVNFKVQRNTQDYEDVMSYNELMDSINNNEDNTILWKFKQITAHQGPLSSTHPDYKGLSYNLTVEWENGETTDEPLNVIAVDAPIECARYARSHDLLDQPGWKRLKRLSTAEIVVF